MNRKFSLIAVLSAFILLGFIREIVCQTHLQVSLEDRLNKVAGVLTPDASYRGTQPAERVGYCLSGVGDVNDDGYDDFAIGNFHTNITGYNAGAVYLIFGKASGFQHNVSLNDADARLLGKQAYDAVGYDVATQGDVNGDGIEDLLMGACAGGIPENPGHAYLVFGVKDANWGSNFIVPNQADASFDGENGVDLAGLSVDIIEDMNGDGFDELIIGAPNQDPWGGDTNHGKTYLFKGKASGWIKNIPLTNADAIFIGDISQSLSGYSTKDLGDVNGDGITDFGIGARNAGKVYLIFGRSEMNWGKNFSLANADVIFSYESYSSWVGWKIAKAGDVNGDSYDDFIIGAPYYTSSSNKGKVYLILGKSTGQWSDINLSNADASFVGENNGDQAGWGIGGNLDFNSDGFSDFLIGAWQNDGNGEGSGKVYLIKGKQSGWQNNVNLSTINDYFLGEHTNDYVGFAASTSGDFNGDYADDFVTSATYNHELYDKQGKIYLFLGEKVESVLSGQVLYHSNNTPVPNVDIQVNETTGFGTTNQNGEYNLLLINGQDYMVMPSKANGEDLESGSISSYDAALVARHAVGLEYIDLNNQILADGDQDGKISVFDASLIARYGVGIPNLPGCHVGDWFFAPDTMNYLNFNQNMDHQDYAAFVIGDVDGSWSAPVIPEEISNEVSGSPYLIDAMTIKEDTIIIKYEMANESHLLSFDCEFEYDQNNYRYLGYRSFNRINQFNFVSHVNSGQVRIGAHGIYSIQQGGCFLEVKFYTRGKTSEKGILLKRFQINDKILKKTHYYDPIAKKSIPLNFQVYQNHPNPFNSLTSFQVYVPKDGRIHITVINPNGVVIRSLVQCDLYQGMHRFAWDGKNDHGFYTASGLYFISVHYGNAIRNSKVIFIK